MDKKKTTPTPEIKKRDVIRALQISPSNEKVIMYETGRAYDISLKLRDMRSDRVTIVVLK